MNHPEQIWLLHPGLTGIVEISRMRSLDNPTDTPRRPFFPSATKPVGDAYDAWRANVSVAVPQAEKGKGRVRKKT